MTHKTSLSLANARWDASLPMLSAARKSLGSYHVALAAAFRFGRGLEWMSWTDRDLRGGRVVHPARSRTHVGMGFKFALKASRG
jgi:hypothetical protein